MKKRAIASRICALALGLACFTSTWSAPAQASDPCLTAPVEGQKLRKDGKLTAARDRFAVCSRNACPKEIVQSCMRWGAEVEGAIPSAVLAARDASGGDLADAQVSIDGAAAVDLSPRALELDPGPHHFAFHRKASPDAQEIAQDVVLREGEKNREVLVTFGTPGALAPGAASQPAMVEPARVPLLTWVFGGLGVVALASFATSGALGIAERSADHCASGCTQLQKDDVNSKFVVADISLGAGVVALGIATVLYLVRSTPTPAAAAWVDVQPTRGGGLGMVGARF